MKNDFKGELDMEGEVCIEIMTLYSVFNKLLLAKRFAQSDFMQKPAALAVIDLADSCSIFEEAFNYKATGVCYNNMANFQYKNEAYSLAIQNYEHAIFLAEVCLGTKPPSEYYDWIKKNIKEQIPDAPRLTYRERERITKSHAHRTYQKVMCKYKEMRYLGGV